METIKSDRVGDVEERLIEGPFGAQGKNESREIYFELCAVHEMLI